VLLPLVATDETSEGDLEAAEEEQMAGEGGDGVKTTLKYLSLML
jgi:hypothetical protein